MINLALDCINERAHYYVMQSPKGNYIFETALGIHYSISLEKIDPIRSQHDPNVEQTILTIIDEFFRTYLNVLLYLCDDSDGREKTRNRLFLTWFEKHADQERFTIRTASTTIEGHGFYAAIIVENRNPMLKAITEDFENTTQILTEGKP